MAKPTIIYFDMGPIGVLGARGLVAGDSLRVEIDHDRIVLTPRRERRPSSRLSTSARTGLPVLRPAAKAPTVTSDLVARLLEELP